jgi:hypothetical protein
MHDFLKIKSMKNPPEHQISTIVEVQIYANLVVLSSINSNSHQATDNAYNTIVHTID